MFDFGILGLNARNILYIKKFNDKKAIRLADNKIKTKEFLQSRSIPVGTTFANISSKEQLDAFDFSKIPSDSFVIKPNKGSQGKGIQIVSKVEGVGDEGQPNVEFRIQGDLYTETAMRYMMWDILDGKYSITGNSDTILIEEKLIPNRDFAKYCDYGLADIRVIVFNLVPVAAMLRLPTQESGGKANLARGGIGLGLNVATGTVEKLLRNKKVYQNEFPEGYEELQGDRLPYWDLILQYSSKIQFYTNLGYLALDWVITTDGPKLLEMNARAGLEVQNANILPLRRRLEQVSNLTITDPEKGVEIAKTLFDNDTQGISQQNKLYLREMAVVPAVAGDVEVELRVNLNQSNNTIAPDLAKKLRQPVQITVPGRGVSIKGVRYETDAALKPNELVLGRTSIQGYYIDPKDNIIQLSTSGRSTREHSLREIDAEIHKLGKKFNLSRILKPKNYFEELDVFINMRGNHNPVFTYDFPSAHRIDQLAKQIDAVREKLFAVGVKKDMSHLLSEKLDELEVKKELLRAYVRQDAVAIDKYNTQLFGEIEPALIEVSRKKLQEQFLQESTVDSEIMEKEEIIAAIEKYLSEHQMDQVPVVFDSGTISRVAVKFNAEGPYVSISPHTQIFASEIRSVLNHEIGVHLKRYVSGKATGWEILAHGTGFYLTDEEGLAVHNSISGLDPSIKKNGMYKKYLLCDGAKEKTFAELAELAQSLSNKSLEQVFNACLRVKKGIVQTADTLGCCYQKDIVYLNGFTEVSEWVTKGGNPNDLFRGKVKIADLPYLETPKDLLKK